MSHSPILSTFFKVELIASTILIVVLLAIGIRKKERILSDATISKFKLHWSKFKGAFYLGLLAMVLFLALLATEMIEASRGMAFRSLYPLEAEWIKVSLVFVLFFVNLINLYILLVLVGGGE
ncbi:MAG: hypothetical protein ACE5HH_00725 [Candidatus Hydrothermarchaeales archaeon]